MLQKRGLDAPGSIQNAILVDFFGPKEHWIAMSAFLMILMAFWLKMAPPGGGGVLPALYTGIDKRTALSIPA